MCFILANSADPNEMPHYAAFYQGPHCLLKYLFAGIRVSFSMFVESVCISTNVKFTVQ